MDYRSRVQTRLSNTNLSNERSGLSEKVNPGIKLGPPDSFSSILIAADPKTEKQPKIHHNKQTSPVPLPDTNMLVKTLFAILAAGLATTTATVLPAGRRITQEEPVSSALTVLPRAALIT